MTCDALNCVSNENGYCADSSYVSIDKHGVCRNMIITDEETEDGNSD